jgi:signal transduction histidine kinase
MIDLKQLLRNTSANEQFVDWAYRVTELICIHFKGLQAVTYQLVNEADANQLSALSSFGVSLDKVKSPILYKDGIIGEVAYTKRRFVTTLNFNCTQIENDGLVQIKPKTILIQPMIYHGELAGVLELHALVKLSAAELDLIASYCSTLAGIFLSEALEEQRRKQQIEAIEREKINSLVSVIAGTAHQINSPLAAIKAFAEESLSDMNSNFMKNFADLILSLDSKQLKMTLALIQYENKNKKAEFSKQLRRAKKDIIMQLENAKIPHVHEVVSLLSNVNLLEVLPHYTDLFASAKGIDIATIIYKARSFTKALEEIIVACEQTKRIVFSLKSYVQIDNNTNELIPIQLKSTVDSIMPLIVRQIKFDSVKLSVEIPEALMIVANADEISQVWLNLIQNALHAINYNGIISVLGSIENNKIKVEVQDNGSGIPADIKYRIFNPFFTTKIKGEGTGLGLSICKKIIRKHRGDIYFESAPGKTVFTVTLPAYEH